MHTRLTSFLAVTGLVFFGVASTARAAERTHDIEPEDYFSIVTMTECAFSPDGARVAYTEVTWGEPKERRTPELWLVDRDTQKRTRLTFERVGATDPQWSPDGEWIYFGGRYTRPSADGPPYDGKTQVWRISREGGEPFPITRIKGGVGLFKLSADGGTLYFTKDNEVVADEWKDLQKEFSSLTYGHGVNTFNQVWALDLESWREKKVVDEKRVISDLAIAPDGKRIAMITRPDEALLTNEGWSRVDVYDSKTEKVSTFADHDWRKDQPTPYGWLGSLAFSKDGDALAFTIDYDGYPSEVQVIEWNGESAALHKLDRPDRLSVTGALQWRGDSRDLCFLAEERARVRVYCFADVKDGKQGECRTLTPGDIAATDYDLHASGDLLAVVMSTTQHMRDLFTVSPDGAYERVTNTNPQVDTWKLPQISLVTWKGANGDEVEGVLELPPDYKEGDGPLPMVVELHGGPTASTLYRIRFWIYGRTLLPAKGYALLSPNYRGSTGYGDKFLTGLIGRENDIEIQDILAGVDAMVERGIADPDKLGVMGWSNGGLLTNCIITHTDRFKAASSGAGIVDMVLQWGTEDTPGHVINYMQGLPWETPDAYRKASAVYAFDKISTPTLIHVGGSDHRCPPAHSKSLYRALTHYLDVPAQLVIYPGEGHGLLTRENRLAKMKWDLAWFDKYLAPVAKQPSEE